MDNSSAVLSADGAESSAAQWRWERLHWVCIPNRQPRGLHPPLHFEYTQQGFAFVKFHTGHEAQAAMNALVTELFTGLHASIN